MRSSLIWSKFYFSIPRSFICSYAKSSFFCWLWYYVWYTFALSSSHWSVSIWPSKSWQCSAYSRLSCFERSKRVDTCSAFWWSMWNIAINFASESLYCASLFLATYSKFYARFWQTTSPSTLSIFLPYYIIWAFRVCKVESVLISF